MDKAEIIKDRYESRIIAILKEIGDTLSEAGFEVGDPFDMSDGEYRWSMLVHRPKREGATEEDRRVDISFTIAEATEREGDDTEGIAFMLDIVEYGGSVLGGLCPYNYTSRLWIPFENIREIADRFSMFEDAEAESVVELCCWSD